MQGLKEMLAPVGCVCLLLTFLLVWLAESPGLFWLAPIGIGLMIAGAALDKPDDSKPLPGMKRVNELWARDAMVKGEKVSRAGYGAYIDSAAWQEKRRAALERAGHRCQLCNSRFRLQAHHRTYARLGVERDDDLIVLCRECHSRHHGKLDD